MQPRFLPRRQVLKTALGLAVSLGFAGAAQAQGPAAPWVIEADEARDLLVKGAVLLDVRSPGARMALPVPGAQPVAWQDFSDPDPQNRGLLLADDAALTGRLRALGLSAAMPVVVVGTMAGGWGEEGRMVWTLRTLGHPSAFMVNGGVAALLDGGAPPIRAPLVPGDFTVARTDAFDIRKEELASLIGNPDVVILDTREPREYAGATPYGESRGGHVPGARPVYFKDLVGADGKILDSGALRARLRDLGVTEGTRVISYCTGGIRSGFVTAVLQDLGVDARNYAGSMWEWSAQDAALYPLVAD